MTIGGTLLTFCLANAVNTAVAVGADPFLKVRSRGEIYEFALDLDKDGKFDYFDISWGPLSIKKTFLSDFKGTAFTPSLDISYNLGKKTLHANYLCNEAQCKLVRAYYSGPTIYKLAESSSSETLDPSRSMTTSGPRSSPCDLGARKSTVENRAIFDKASSKLIADLVFDSSCQAKELGQKSDKIVDDLREDFISFLNMMQSRSIVGRCLSNSPDTLQIEKMMTAKLGEIKSGNLPFRVKCMPDPAGRRSPEISENPLIMTIPILGNEGTCARFNYKPIFAHEISHISGAKGESIAAEIQGCFGESLIQQASSCGFVPNVFDGSAEAAASEVKVESVNIAKNSLVAATPPAMDRGINGPNVPSEPIIKQAMGVVREGLGASPEQPFVAAARNLDYFDLRSGNIGQMPAQARMPSNTVGQREVANTSATARAIQSNSGSSGVGTARVSRGLLSSSGPVDMSGQRLTAESSIATKTAGTSGNAEVGAVVLTKAGGNTNGQNRERGPASAISDPAKPTVATSGAPTQQGLGTQQSIGQSGSVAKISGASASIGGAPGGETKPQNQREPKGGSAQKVSAEGPSEAVKIQITKILDEIAKSLRANPKPGDLEQLKSKYGPTLQSKNVSVSFGNKDSKVYLGVPADRARLVYRISDGQVFDLSKKK